MDRKGVHGQARRLPQILKLQRNLEPLERPPVGATCGVPLAQLSNRLELALSVPDSDGFLTALRLESPLRSSSHVFTRILVAQRAYAAVWILCSCGPC